LIAALGIAVRCLMEEVKRGGNNFMAVLKSITPLASMLLSSMESVIRKSTTHRNITCIL